MAELSRLVRVEHLDHDHDHWCNHCRLSTGVRAWIVRESGPALSLTEQLWCVECGSRDVTVSPDARRCR